MPTITKTKELTIAAPQYHKIPQELKDVGQWINFASEWLEAKNKWTKPPCGVNGLKAKGGFKNHVTYDQAKEAQERIPDTISGVGYVFDQGDPDIGIIGLDFDHVVLEDGSILPEVEEILGELNSYTEYSISGDGLHVFVEAKGLVFPGGARKFDEKGAFGENTGLEIFKDSGYMTVSGKRLDKYGTIVRPKCKTKVDAMLKKYAKKRMKKSIRAIKEASTEPMFGELGNFCAEFTERTGIAVADYTYNDEDGEGSYMIKLTECPWGGGETEAGDTHEDGPNDAVIFFTPGRRPGFYCFHTTCEGRSWDDLCAKFPALPLGNHIDRYNSEFCIVSHGANVYVTRDKLGSREDSYGTAKKAKTFFEERKWDNKTISNPSGDDKVLQLAECWFNSKHARRYEDGYELAPPGAPENPVEGHRLNLWNGFVKKPEIAGSCEKFKQHWKNIVCNGNEEIYEWTRMWFADIIQNPGMNPPDTSIIVKGLNGSGKSIIADVFGRIIGLEYFADVTCAKDLSSKFNSHIASCVLVSGAEITFKGDRVGHNQLKGIITTKTRSLEGKNKDVVKVNNITRYYITTNARVAIPADRTERRFLILETKAMVQREGYFADIWKELERGGFERLLWEMTNEVDVDREVLRRAPNTESLLEEKQAALHGFERFMNKFIMDAFEPPEGELAILGADNKEGAGGWPETFKIKGLYWEYLEFSKDKKEHSSEQLDYNPFSKRLRAMNKEARLGFQLSGGGKNCATYNTKALESTQENWIAYLNGHIA